MEEKRGASQGIGDQKAAIRTKSSLGLNCQLFRVYIQVQTSMTNSPNNRLVRRLVSPSVSSWCQSAIQSSFISKAYESVSCTVRLSVSLWVTSVIWVIVHESRDRVQVGPENTSYLISLRPRDGAYHLGLLTLCLPGFGALGIWLQVDIGIRFSGRLALLACCRPPC